MILLYRILTTLIYPFLIFLIIFRKIIKKEDSKRFKEKIFPSCFNIIKDENKELIWFHAASIGEFISILPILAEINKISNKYEFLITTTTLSSARLADEELKKIPNTQHRFFPLDVEFLIKNFLFLWKPKAIFLVDSEIWPNLIYLANKKGIPIALLNARITLKTFNRWMLFPSVAKRIFGLFNLCLASNTETKNYLTKFHAKNIYFNGNIKLVSHVDRHKIKNLNEKIFLKRRFWLAASTHEGEEEFCIKTHYKIKQRYGDILTIIAPRHIQRTKEIEKLCEKFNINYQTLSKNEIILEDKELIIINSFGVLQNYFKYVKSVFIGKSTISKLKNDAGQNPIDAAKLGCKVYHGPYIYNFKETYEVLEKNNISKKIENTKELSDEIIRDLENPYKEDSKISVLINNLGQKTLADTMKNINNFLLNEIN